jgi:membrane-associated protease RseP (regulator of RpoE activity)
LSNETPSGPPFSGTENDEPVFHPSSIEPVRDSHRPPPGDGFVYQPRVRFKHVWWKHIVLFVLTLITTTMVGVQRYLQFLSDFGRSPVPIDAMTFWDVLTSGFWYSGTILAILGAHEMGHYMACRRYKVDATLPYFIPLFLGSAIIQIGTLGAVIRIREAFPTRKVLFDVGVAGPIAGFVVLVPALFLGMYMSNVTISPPPEGLTFIGKPLLFRLARWLIFGPIREGSIVNLHPMVWAAWFGMLATALNLLPFGQLDGGHITYATLGRISTKISLVTVGAAVVMTFISLNWLLMTIVMFVMLLVAGPHHPPVINEYEPLDPGRRAVAAFAFAMLIVCFTPFPIEI